MTKRIELTVSDEEFERLESERGLVPRAAWIKARLFEPVERVSPELEAKLKGAWDSSVLERQLTDEAPLIPERAALSGGLGGEVAKRVTRASKLAPPQFNRAKRLG